jgi:hypothetical protein
VARAGRQGAAEAMAAASPAAGRTCTGRPPASWATSCLRTKFPNDRLLGRRCATIRDGDILMAHLGIWSRGSVRADARSADRRPQGARPVLRDAARAPRLPPLIGAGPIRVGLRLNPDRSTCLVQQQTWLFEASGAAGAVRDGLDALRLEELFDFTEWVVLGAIEVAVLAVVLPARAALAAVEPVTDRAASAPTCSTRCCIGSAASRWWCSRCSRRCSTRSRRAAAARLHRGSTLDQVWPGVTDMPLVSFLIYLVVLDFVDYWLHRGQHGCAGGGRCTRCTTASADDVLERPAQPPARRPDARRALALVALLIGVAPGPVRRAGDRDAGAAERAACQPALALRSARAAAAGQPELPSAAPRDRLRPRGPARGVNFAVLFPWWDMLFGPPTGGPASCPPASATSSTAATTGAASGRSSGWLAPRRRMRAAAQ